VITGFFTPAMLLVLLALIPSRSIWGMLTQPKPEQRPAEDKTGWPMWFVSVVFLHNRFYGMLFLIGLIADAIIKNVIL
jgi:1,4-dihydroxy-2-naphthoate polyprenyltransferase